MRTHIEKLRLFTRRLADAGQDIGDPGLITVILNSLPQTWKVEKTVLRARPNNTLDYVMRYLCLEADSRAEGPDSKEEESTLALGAESQANAASQSQVRCFACNRLGHVQANCNLRGRFYRRGRGNFRGRGRGRGRGGRRDDQRRYNGNSSTGQAQ